MKLNLTRRHVVTALVVVGLGIAGILLQPHFPEEERIQVVHEEVKQEEQTQPAKPYDRIVSIVEQYDEYPVITNLADPNAKDPQPPYEVIVVMSNVKSCFSAKDKALGIMRDLYLDPVAATAISRVKAINNMYLSASLGANDARTISADAWKGNGPTNFIKALQGGADYDMDDLQEATSKTVAGYTYAELHPNCTD